MKKFNHSVLIALTILVFGNSAQAATITNLAKEDRVIQVYDNGVLKDLTIKAYATYRITGDLRVHIRDKDIYIEWDEEYAWWPDGTFGPQRMTDYNPRFK